MYAVLEWDADAPADEWARVIAEDQTEESAKVVLQICPAHFHREMITMEELSDMRKVESDHDAEREQLAAGS